MYIIRHTLRAAGECFAGREGFVLCALVCGTQRGKAGRAQNGWNCAGVHQRESRLLKL